MTKLNAILGITFFLFQQQGLAQSTGAATVELINRPFAEKFYQIRQCATALESGSVLVSTPEQIIIRDLENRDRDSDKFIIYRRNGDVWSFELPRSLRKTTVHDNVVVGSDSIVKIEPFLDTYLGVEHFFKGSPDRLNGATYSHNHIARGLNKVRAVKISDPTELHDRLITTLMHNTPGRSFRNSFASTESRRAPKADHYKALAKLKTLDPTFFRKHFDDRNYSNVLQSAEYPASFTSKLDSLKNGFYPTFYLFLNSSQSEEEFRAELKGLGLVTPEQKRQILRELNSALEADSKKDETARTGTLSRDAIERLDVAKFHLQRELRAAIAAANDLETLDPEPFIKHVAEERRRTAPAINDYLNELKVCENIAWKINTFVENIGQKYRPQAKATSLKPRAATTLNIAAEGPQ